ncbi:MAG: hypothetical protein QOH42_1921, partial [Blastocatellia bacterium]|nr:hypothetical protein [Blastocatellia bacterium]
FEFQRLKVFDLSSKSDFDAKLFTAMLKDFQQTQARDSGKAITVNRDLLAAMNDVDVVPGRKVPCDFGVRAFIGGAQIRQCLSGEHHAPTKGVVRAIAFMDGNVVRASGALHEDGEVHAGRAATDDIDFHFPSSTAIRDVSVNSLECADLSALCLSRIVATAMGLSLGEGSGVDRSRLKRRPSRRTAKVCASFSLLDLA